MCYRCTLLLIKEVPAVVRCLQENKQLDESATVKHNNLH